MCDMFMLYNFLLCYKNYRKNKAVTAGARTFNFSYEHLSKIRFYCRRRTCYARIHGTVLIANDETGTGSGTGWKTKKLKSVENIAIFERRGIQEFFLLFSLFIRSCKRERGTRRPCRLSTETVPH